MLRDATTPTEDFIISAHPVCAGLYIATAGSLHAYKFLPILGKYVLQMLGGNLEPHLAKLWAWDRPVQETGGRELWPIREMRDVV